MDQRIQKACDGCRIRKVKCTGTQPCGQCNHLNLLCKFSVAKGHRLPPVRGRLLAQLRQVGTGASELPILSSVAEQENSGRYMTPAKEQQLRPLSHFPEHPYSEDFFTRLLPDYERAAYPVNPIITSDEIAESILHMRTDPTHAALVYAFAAVTINLGQTSWPLNGEISARIRDLMWRSLSARHQVDPDDALREMPTSVRRIMTCIFLEICMMAFKSLADMELLTRESHARGMRVMLDLVINHTSDRHPWFVDSRSSRANPKRDWYIWRKARYGPDGQRYPPNNWRANFGGGSAWEWDPVTEEYYLHLFAKEQPDLNCENPVTRRALYASSMEFWLERGVDAFRVDTVNMYSKPPGLPDAPISNQEADVQAAYTLYCNGPRIHEYVGEMNAILRKHNAITVGELPHTPEMERVLKYVSAEARQLDMVFQFDVADVGVGKMHKFDTVPRAWTLSDLKRAVARTQDLIRGTDAWTTVFLENHDQARSISRFASDLPEHRVASGKMLALLETTLSGTLFLYQGQEIGAVNAPGKSYPIAEYRDIESLLYYKMVDERTGGCADTLDRAFSALQHLARDHARIPMAWDGAAPNAGFSAADGAGTGARARPWMATHPLASEINVADQINNERSVLSFWRKMLRFRREHVDLLVYGDFRLLRVEDPDLFMFAKDNHQGDMAVVVLNFTKSTKGWDQPRPEELGLGVAEGIQLTMLVSSAEGADGGNLLAPFEARIYRVDT